MKTFVGLSLVCLGVLAMGNAIEAADAVKDAEVAKRQSAPLDVKMETLDGKPVDLAKKYRGKVVLLVNVASECGYTKQYAPLQALHEKYVKQGLAIIGVPCNQFGEQEPGTAKEIAEFCKANYGVEFDMLGKVDVNGEKAAALYKYLTSKETNPKFAGPIKWNFEKFLINRDGQVVARWGSKVKPESEEVVKAIEAELAKKPAATTASVK